MEQAMDQFSGILAFVRAAEERSFTKAAHKLWISPSGVSKAISGLEAQFKVRLVHRTSRSITITPEGAAFYERCRQIVADLEDAGQLLSRAQEAPRGLLRVTLPLSVGRLHLARALPEFARRYPDVKMEASLTNRRVDLVEEGFDVAVRMGKPPDSRLVARQLTTGVLSTCAAPPYLKRHGVPRRPEDLANHNCVHFVVPSTARVQDWKFQRGGKQLSIPVPGNLSLDHAEALVEAALAGTALIQISSYVTAPAIRTRVLKTVLTEFQVDSPPVWVMYRHNRNLTPRVRAFVDFLVEWAERSRLSVKR
jgi:LysR family transcriptional regulator, regulator for bpeEF and oprC